MHFAEHPGERGEALRAVYAVVRDSMPSGFELIESRGAPSWVVPLSTYPVTYNGEPLSYISLMAQKNYNSLYLMGLYSDPDAVAAFERDWLATGRRLDMGKSCLRFRTLADVDLDIIARVTAATSVEQLVAAYERSRKA